MKLIWLADRACRRCTSSTSYRKTLNMFSSKFQVGLKDGLLLRTDERLAGGRAMQALYEDQLVEFSDRPVFVLHDGPPYANGPAHIGHALNRLFKDIILRYKLTKGFRVHFQPGWDCHGLPIELKALQLSGKSPKDNPADVRRLCKTVASDAVEMQKSQFQSWGLLADWKSFYRTDTLDYSIRLMRAFQRLYEKDLVYRAKKPVYWSPVSITALAESELEYQPDHQSTSLLVAFQVLASPIPALQERLSSGVFVVVWTTTPWTLPANEAVCVGANLAYDLWESDDSRCFIVANKCDPAVMAQLKDRLGKLRKVATFPGEDLTKGHRTCYEEPFSGNRKPVLNGAHVTETVGTGLVHTAPAHGFEDFDVAIDHDLPINDLVDSTGCFTGEVPLKSAIGKSVFDCCSDVCSFLVDRVLHQSTITHSYPYDWRSKTPVIIRATKQWFIDQSSILEGNPLVVLDETSESTVRVCPDSYQDLLPRMLQTRKRWCISRQRCWGTPLPVFYDRLSGDHLFNGEVLDHCVRLFQQDGSTDSWFSGSNLLPKSFPNSGRYQPSGEVMDVWMDSGLSWTQLDGNQIADVYLEGIDQFRGWFQSSYLLSAALRSRPPFRTVVTHGFVVDENGRKMSKSLGNVVDPADVRSQFGVSVLRHWAAVQHGSHHIEIGPAVLRKSFNSVGQLRLRLRFLLSNLTDFPVGFVMSGNRSGTSCLVASSLMEPIDRRFAASMVALRMTVGQHFDDYRIDSAMKAFNNFVDEPLSDYLTIVKDRLYCCSADSLERRSAQSGLFVGLLSMLLMCWPVLPHCAEEVWCTLMGLDEQTERSVALRFMEFDKLLSDYHCPEKASHFLSLAQLRRQLQSIVQSELTQFEFHFTQPNLFPFLLSSDELSEILGCARVIVGRTTALAEDADDLWREATSSFGVVLWKFSDLARCSRCRLAGRCDDGQLCSRCSNVMQQLLSNTSN